MLRCLSVLFWTVVFLILLLGIDQLLVRVPVTLPAHDVVATFYRDLRSRALDLARGVKAPAPPAPDAPAKPAPPVRGALPRGPASVEAVIGQRKTVSPKVAVKPAAKVVPRYVYADAQGELHFAETRAEVPAPYRGKAKALGE